MQNINRMTGAPSLSRRSLARQGGDVDFGPREDEVKIPTLPQRTREGWGVGHPI